MTAPENLPIDNQKFSKLILVDDLTSKLKDVFYKYKYSHQDNTNEFDGIIYKADTNPDPFLQKAESLTFTEANCMPKFTALDANSLQKNWNLMVLNTTIYRNKTFIVPNLRIFFLC